MSARAVARGVVMAVAAGLMLGAAAQANEAAHKMAEKFAGSTDAAHKGKPAEAKQQDTEKSEAAKAKDAERKAAQAKERAAAQKAQAARRASEARRKAAAAAWRAAEERKADEADMLARARREAEDMRAADEHARLTQEARRLVEEAQKERARAEALLAGRAEDKGAETADEEGLARQRTEETRRLVEKLNRVRQIREARLAAQAQRRAEERRAAPPIAETSPSARPSEPPAVAIVPEAPPVPPADAPAERSEPTVAASVPPPAPAPAAAALPPVVAEVAPPPAAASPAPRLGPRVAAAEMDAKTAAEIPAPTPPEHPARGPARLSGTQVTVLLILEPGTYGIRRRGPRIADPILCVPEGCYISTGPDRPAEFMPGRMAFRFGNTFGARAGACRGSLGCVFRDVELGSLPGYLQPVDLHILKHDRREVHTVLNDSGCRTAPGQLVCTHGVQAEDYTMWIVPESLAAAAGPAALERAVADGLNGRRSAELTPR